MWLKSRNLNIVRLVAWLLYIIFKIILQILFQIWFLIGQEIIFCLKSILFHWESTYSGFQHLTVFKVRRQYARMWRNKIQAKCIMEIMIQLRIWKTCFYIYFDMLGLNVHPGCRDLIYIDPNGKKLNCCVK